MKRILDRITDGFFAVDREWRIVYANRRSAELVPVPEARPNAILWDVRPGPEECELARGYVRAVETGEPQHFEGFYAPHDLWYEVHAYPSEEGLSVYFRDITERREIEEVLHEQQERLELVVRATQEVIYEWDLGTGHVWQGGAVSALFGFSPREPTFAWWTDRIHEEDRPEVVDSVRRAVDGDATFWSREYRLINAHDEVVHVLDRATIVRDEDGKAERVIGAVVDVTDRKMAEEFLRASREQARRLARQLITVQEEERGRIARDIHDVLGQALTAMKIDAMSLARSAGLSDEERSRARRIADLVDETVKNVREMSTRLRPIVLDDLGLVAALRAEARSLTERTGIACEVVDRTQGLDLGDELSTAIFRIVQEALTNVARHSGASRARIELVRSDDAITVEIHDDGRGVAEQLLHAGTSLGIPGMRERMFLVGGELTVRRGEGERGTVVALTVPADVRERLRMSRRS